MNTRGYLRASFSCQEAKLKYFHYLRLCKITAPNCDQTLPWGSCFDQT